MRKILLALALVTLSAPAFADSFSAQADDAVAADSSSVFVDENGQEMAVDEQENLVAPDAPMPGVRYPYIHGWRCIAADRFGHRFMGRGFLPGAARSSAMSMCQHSHFPIGWYRGCHIVRCFMIR